MTLDRPRAVNFDRIARPYRWMEYLSFGPVLERCRFHRIPQLLACKRALVLGDGDGRFLTRLLAANRGIAIDAIDISPAMLRLAAARARAGIPDAESRLRLYCMDARDFRPTAEAAYDLVVTHFFLDCFNEDDIAGMMQRISPHLTPGALWVVSEFQVPATGTSRYLARAVIAGLYRAFGLLTGLRTRRLPRYALLFRQEQFVCQDTRTWAAAMLTSEVWQQEIPSNR